jgi:hypothetical protein
MGRARRHQNGAVISDRRRNLFSAVLGGGHGLTPEASLARDLAAINVEQLIAKDNLNALANAFFCFRNTTVTERVRLHTYLSTRLAGDIWDNWRWNTAANSLNMMGFGTRNRSPWLIVENHPKDASGCVRTIHVDNIHLDGIRINSEDSTSEAPTADTLRKVQTLCGANVWDLTEHRPQVREHSNYRGARGEWYAPLAIAAQRCSTCEAKASDLAVPVLNEQSSIALRLGDSDFENLHLTQLITQAENLLDHAPTYETVVTVLNELARDAIIERAVTDAASDPIPVIVACLDASERKHLSTIPQPLLQTQLQALDWKHILNGAFPRHPRDAFHRLIFHDRLQEAAGSIQ